MYLMLTSSTWKYQWMEMLTIYDQKTDRNRGQASWIIVHRSPITLLSSSSSSTFFPLRCPVEWKHLQLSYCSLMEYKRIACSSDSNFFPGTRPNKWLYLNNLVDMSDLRRQQIARYWQTREIKQRNTLTTQIRLSHCIRRKDTDILRDANLPIF